MKYIKMIFILLPLIGWSNEKKIRQVLSRELKLAKEVHNRRNTRDSFFRVFSIQLEILRLNYKRYLSLVGSVKEKSEFNKVRNQYSQIDKMAKVIHGREGSFKDSDNFYYLYALMTFEFSKDYKYSENVVNLAIRETKSQKNREKLYGKVGDFFYNNQQYKKAKKYYEVYLRDRPKSKWKDRYRYNLAWCYFNDDQQNKALAKMLEIYNEYVRAKDKKENYYFQQTLKHIPFFYVYTGRSRKGLEFLLSSRTKKIEDYFKFIKLMYDKGFYGQAPSSIIRIENFFKKEEELLLLLKFRVKIYEFFVNFTFKRDFELNKRLRNVINKNLAIKKNRSEPKELYVTANKRLLDAHVAALKNTNTKYESNNYFMKITQEAREVLETLIQLEPENRNQYIVAQAELIARQGLGAKAFYVLIKTFNAQKDKIGTIALIERSFIVYQKYKSKIDINKIAPFLKFYIKHGKDAKFRSFAYENYYEYQLAKKLHFDALETTKDYYSNDKTKRGRQSTMLAQLLAIAVAADNYSLIASIRTFIKLNPTLKSNSSINKLFSESYQNKVVKAINKLINDGNHDKAKIASRLSKYFRDLKVDRVSRLVAGYNSGYYYALAGSFHKSEAILRTMIAALKGNELKEYSKNIALLSERYFNPLDSNYSIKLTNDLFLKSCSVKSTDRASHLGDLVEYLLFSDRVNEIYKFVEPVKKCPLDEYDRKKIINLIISSTNLFDEEEFKETYRIVAQSSIGSQSGASQVLIQKFKLFLIEQRYITSKVFNRFIAKHQKYNLASMFWSEVKQSYVVLRTIEQNLVYPKLDLKNLESVLDKLFSTVSSQTELVTKIPGSFVLFQFLKRQLKIEVLSQSVKQVNLLLPKIVDDQNKDQIAQVLQQTKAKFKSEIEEQVVKLNRDKTNNFNFIRHRFFRRPMFFRSLGNPIIMDLL